MNSGAQDNPRNRRVVLGVDPGRSKCGAAACAPSGVLARAIVPPEALPDLVREWHLRYGITEIVVGNRTGSHPVARALELAVPLPVRMVDEAGTTLRARARYFAEHPPQGWRRLVPRGLLVPPQPYDDYVAVLLAEAMLAQEREE